MKHHPIIFAVGEKVPVISLANFDYYVHKNGGALKLFGLERYNLMFNDDFKIDKFISMYYDIFKYSKYKDDLSIKFQELNIIKKNFINKIEKLLSK